MRPRKLLILFLIILFAVLQSTALNYIQIFKTKPDILLILIAFFSLNFGRMYGLSIGAICGMFSEITSGIPSGFAVLAYSLSGLILGTIGRWVYPSPVGGGGVYPSPVGGGGVNNQKIWAEICISFIFCLVIYFFLFFLFRLFNANLSFFGTLISIILPASFYTAVAAPVIFRFLKTILQIK